MGQYALLLCIKKEPPDEHGNFIGVTLACGIRRSSDERYEDKRDMAHNSFWTSKEELQGLSLLMKKDPENSADWPTVVEWCSSCAITRGVKLVLSEEEIKVIEEERGTTDVKVDEEKTSCDVSTQTPRQKPRRRGGQGSRKRRMLAYQLMLTVKRGLPMSRLLSNQGTDGFNAEELTIWSQSFNFHTFLNWASHFSFFSPPSTSLQPTRFPPLSNSTVLPDACSKLGFLWRLPMLGPHHPNLVRPVALFGSCTMPASTIHDS